MRDDVREAWRGVRSRLVESLLIVLATAVGVGMTAATLTYYQSYRAETNAMVQYPSYREVTVRARIQSADIENAAEPVVAGQGVVQLDGGMISTALAESPDVAYGYQTQTQTLTFSTERFVGRGEMPPPEALPGAPAPGTAPRPAPADAAEPPGTTADAAEPAASGRGLPAPENVGVFDAVAIESAPGMRVTPQIFAAYGLAADGGSLFTQDDVSGNNYVMVVGGELAQEMFGDGPTGTGADGRPIVGRVVPVNGVAYTVIGVLAPAIAHPTLARIDPNRMAFVPLIQQTVQLPDGRSIVVGSGNATLRFAVDDVERLSAAKRQIEQFFYRDYSEQSIIIETQLVAVQTARDQHARLITVVLFLSVSALFIASINIFNLMLTRVMKRVRTVGILRALGATRVDVFRRFFVESSLLSGMGTLVGIAAAPLLYAVLHDNLGTDTQLVAGAAPMNFLVLVGSAIGAMALSLLFGVMPAFQASHVDPAVAIRTE